MSVTISAERDMIDFIASRTTPETTLRFHPRKSRIG